MLMTRYYNNFKGKNDLCLILLTHMLLDFLFKVYKTVTNSRFHGKLCYESQNFLCSTTIFY